MKKKGKENLMAKFKCSFCKAKVFIKKIEDIPKNWGVLLGKQGHCTVEFKHCPDHENYKRLNLWDLIERELPTPATIENPTPF